MSGGALIFLAEDGSALEVEAKGGRLSASRTIDTKQMRERSG